MPDVGKHEAVKGNNILAFALITQLLRELRGGVVAGGTG